MRPGADRGRAMRASGCARHPISTTLALEQALLNSPELATIRAALLYWREEICPHGSESAALYFDDPRVAPLAADEVEQLRRKFDAAQIRYDVCDAVEQRHIE